MSPPKNTWFNCHKQKSHGPGVHDLGPILCRPGRDGCSWGEAPSGKGCSLAAFIGFCLGFMVPGGVLGFGRGGSLTVVTRIWVRNK